MEPGVIMVQIISHDTQRRGQIKSILTALGIERQASMAGGMAA
jgi:hypothetical protein